MVMYVVRHAPTEWNQSGRIQGRMDIGLSCDGVMQALELSDYLQGWEFRWVFTSPLTRAKQTLEIALSQAECTYERFEKPDLMEIDCGRYTGKTKKNLRWSFVRQWLWSRKSKYFRAPGGESIVEVYNRAERAVRDINRYKGEKIAFSHEFLIQCMMSYVSGRKLSEIESVPYCSIVELDRGGYSFLRR